MAAPIIKRPAFPRRPSQMADAHGEFLRAIGRLVFASPSTLYRHYGAQLETEKL